jgi:hypothetical protein
LIDCSRIIIYDYNINSGNVLNQKYKVGEFLYVNDILLCIFELLRWRTLIYY